MVSDRKFPTAEETAYPIALAYAIAYNIACELISKGWNPPALELSPPENVSYQYLRAIVGVQPKASKVPPLLSEFSHVISCAVSPSDLPVAPGQQLTTCWRGIPAGSRLLRKPPLRLNGGTTNSGTGEHVSCSLPVACDKVDSASGCTPSKIADGNASSQSLDDNKCSTVFFGVYRS